MAGGFRRGLAVPGAWRPPAFVPDRLARAASASLRGRGCLVVAGLASARRLRRLKCQRQPRLRRQLLQPDPASRSADAGGRDDCALPCARRVWRRPAHADEVSVADTAAWAAVSGAALAAAASAERLAPSAAFEERVLAGLTERLVSAEAVTEAVRAYHEEMNRQNQARRAKAEADRKALAKIERAIAGIIQAVEDGLYQPTMKARFAELERQKAELEDRLCAAEPGLPDVNPNVADLYRRKVTRLAEALAEDHASHEAAIALRSLIGEVVLSPGNKRGEVNATLRGELMGILDFAAAGTRRERLL